MVTSSVLERDDGNRWTPAILTEQRSLEVSKFLERMRVFLEPYTDDTFNPPCFEDWMNGTMVRPQG